MNTNDMRTMSSSLKTVDVLMVGPMTPASTDRLETIFSLHKAGHAAELKPELIQRIRGIAAGSYGVVDTDLMERLPNLEIVSHYGTGYDTIDAVEANRRGIIVTNTPDVTTDEVADLAIGLIIATVRMLPQADRYMREGRWLERPFPLTASLRDRTVGIVGLGRIGRAIARRLEGFDVNICYHGRNPQDVRYQYYPNLLKLAADVDILVVMTPGGDATKHLIGEEVLDALGCDGILINMARGTVIDQGALVRALESKSILAAGLDVFDEEPCLPQDLIHLPNVVLLPHVGSGSVHTRNMMGNLAVDNLVSWFQGRGPINPVTETPWPRIR